MAEALRTWSGRRDRVTYYASATLIEFASPEALEAALDLWAARADRSPNADRRPARCWSRTRPTSRSRPSGSRALATTRRPPEACVEVEPDGVTLALDLGRSDLFVDAEMARFADVMPDEGRGGRALALSRHARIAPPRRRGRGDPGEPLALVRAEGGGPPCRPRCGSCCTPPGRGPSRSAWPARIVLNAPSSDLLDGLLQHPATRDADRRALGPLRRGPRRRTSRPCARRWNDSAWGSTGRSCNPAEGH